MLMIQVPKMVVEVKKHIKRWKKKEVGIRIPSDEICAAILKEVLMCIEIKLSL